MTAVGLMAPESGAAQSEDNALLAALRRGDEAAFVQLVDTYQAPLLRLARIYVDSASVAEEVVQETWLGVVQGLARFEGRSSLKTWIFRILTNRAKTRGQREGRMIPFSAFANPADEPFEPAVEPERFLPASDPEWPHHWAAFPQRWDAVPEAKLLASETRQAIQQAVDTLPPSQREVISLRDIEGWTAQEVCSALGVSETNQRVLLHRARSKVRRALEQYLAESEGSGYGH
jgi:RNA polymerase sigma-70 factor, ECF subfamily